MFDFVLYPFDLWKGIFNALTNTDTIISKFMNITWTYNTVSFTLEELLIAVFTILTVLWIVKITFKFIKSLANMFRGVFNG